jgi:glycosyltransferase involved in cell wall biosynthesis
MLIVLTTHPIQYQVPLWQKLARDGRVPFEVWYLTRHGVEASHDREFGQAFAWDIDSLSGYTSRFLDDAPQASPASFWGCRLTRPLAPRLAASGARVLWVQGWQVRAYWQAVREAHAAGVQVWLRGESNDLAPDPVWKRLAKRIRLGRLFGNVDRFLCIGTGNARLYRRFGVGAERLAQAPYAVDNERFARQAAALRPTRGVLRQRLGIPDDAFCVLFCGKLIPKKRPHHLVAAAGMLMAQGKRIHLLFAGSGVLENELRARCAALHVPASFAGFLNQTRVSEAYVAADGLALPSDFGETWGLVVNEAMASGLPCAVSDQCGCAEDLARSAPNVTFEGGSIPGLVTALAALMAGDRIPQRLPPSLDGTVATVVDLYSAARS